MIRIGIVVQRYGNEVCGETETLARNVAERLMRQGFRVTVFTTCARDGLTWRNEYAPGESFLKGVTIRRFPVARERDMADFERFAGEFFDTPPGGRDEEKWFAEQGPFCPDLVQGLQAGEKGIDLFIFFACFFYPTVEGVPRVSKPVILFPVASEEPRIRLQAVAEAIRRPRGFFFLTRGEMDLVRRMFNPRGTMRLTRIGLDLRSGVDDKPFRGRHLLVAPYLLFAGRIESGEGLEAMFGHYQALKQEAYVDLVLIGEKRMDIPALQGLKYLAHVPEEERLAAFKGAILSIQPTMRAGLAISTLESFSQRTPVLVNRHCPALQEHVENSGAGLAYGNQDDFLAGFRRLYRQPALRAAMGEKGLAYVKKYYSWDAVIVEIKKGIDEILA